MSASTFRLERVARHTQHATDSTAASAGAAALRYPSLTTTVPKEFVHRASIAEVLLTDWDRVDDLHFTVSAQLPRRHAFFAHVGGCHDPLMIAETVRQAGLLLAHAEFAVPLGHQFLMWDLAIDVQPEHLLIAGTPAALEIEIACTDVKRRGANLAGLHFDAVIRRDGQIAATGAATFTCASPALYRRLRSAGMGESVPVPLPLTSPTAPQDVGRLSPTDVVLSPTAGPAAAGGPAHETHCWQLRVDTRHPVLFDHPVDHVPGMVLLEAARQAATAFLGHPCLPTAVTGDFARYAELDTPCLLEVRSLPATTAGKNRVQVSGRQHNQTVFTCAVTTQPTTA
ncbi:ScbA/BarX family gamma-butyrolactone biosynthesis protein [Streptomyces sp. NPDC005486]|uniref:ScbA/BarX family gamma-butyrolactone biosynthesis protein n=1 Tax=Streptomyces sp. NPDC005486 TaxID=3155345 RepID=UPI0033A38632